MQPDCRIFQRQGNYLSIHCFICRVFVKLDTCTGVAVAKASPHCLGLFYLQSRHASNSPISQPPSPGSSPPGSVPLPAAPSFRPIFILGDSGTCKYCSHSILPCWIHSLSSPRDLVSTIKYKEIILSIAVRQLKEGRFGIQLKAKAEDLIRVGT